MDNAVRVWAGVRMQREEPGCEVGLAWAGDMVLYWQVRDHGPLLSLPSSFPHLQSGAVHIYLEGMLG